MTNQNHGKKTRLQVKIQSNSSNTRDISKVMRTKNWQKVPVGTDRSSFMRCGGGPLCNEPHK